MPTHRVYTVVLTYFKAQFEGMKFVHSTIATAPPPVKHNGPVFSSVIKLLCITRSFSKNTTTRQHNMEVRHKYLDVKTGNVQRQHACNF